MTTFVKLAASFVIIILFLLLNSYMFHEQGRATGSGIFGMIFLIGGLVAVWKYKPSKPSDKTNADDEPLNKK